MNIISIFLTSFLLGLALIPILIVISEKTNFLVDVSEGDVLKIHKKNIPLLGGLAMIVSIIFCAVIFFQKSFASEIIGIFTALLPIFFLGFYDDLKWKHISDTKPFLKFALLLICTLVPAVILSYIGISFKFLPIFIISTILSFVYIFVCINAVNYQDGMDGLAGGLAVISLMGFIILSIIFSNVLALYIAVLFLGAVLGFLVFNFPPAKIFMGDSGAYSLGFVLALLAMIFSLPFNLYSVLAPIFIIGLPVFDGVYTNIRRLTKGKSIFLGDRSHFYDKLLQKGYSTKKTLAICYGLQIVLVLVGLALY